MNPIREAELIETRRHFFGRAATGLGAAALTSLLNPAAFARPNGDLNAPHFAPKAKRVIELFMA